MSFANPWGLLGLLSLPAIVFFHWYQRRFPRMAVAGLHLWGAQIETKDAGPKRERPPVSASLLLEIFAALLLTCVLSRPRLQPTERAEHLVVVLDDSASMSAKPENGIAPRDAAVELLQERLAALPEGSIVTILRSGEFALPLAGPEAQPDDALAAISAWQPRQPAHRFEPAWNYATEIAGETGRLLFLTDRLPTDGKGHILSSTPKQMEIVSFGQKSDNVAVTTARWSLQPVYRKETKKVVGIVGRVFCWVENFGERERSVTVLVKNRADREVFRKPLKLPGRAGAAVRFSVAGGVGELRVELKPDRSVLPLDGRLTLLEPRMRVVKIAFDLPKDSPIETDCRSVLELIRGVEFTQKATADLIIAGSNVLPPSRENLWWLGIGPHLANAKKAAQSKPMSKRKPELNSRGKIPYLINRGHPLMRGVKLEGTDWRGDGLLELALVPLIVRKGDVAAGIEPAILFGQLKGTDTTAFLMNIDLAKSKFATRPDWPILLQNLIEERRKALPGLRDSNYRSGQSVAFRLSAEAAAKEGPLLLVHGETERRLARLESIQFRAPIAPGLYEVRDGEKTLGRFAVNLLDAKESNLLTLSTGRHRPDDENARSGFLLDKPLSPVLIALLVLALAALFLDWYVLRPKRGQ